MTTEPEIWDANVHFGTLPFKEGDYSLETLLELMRRYGIARAAVYSLKGVYYDFHEGNEETIAAASEHSCLVPVATVDPRRYVGCVEEIALRAGQGCRALRFFPDIQGWPADYLPVRPLLKQAQACGMAVMFPATSPGQATTILAALGSLEVPLILVDVNYGTMSEAMAAAAMRSEVYIETRRLVTPGGIDALAREVGHQRLVFGSGAPEFYPASALALIEHSALSPAQKRDVLGENLKRALRW